MSLITTKAASSVSGLSASVTPETVQLAIASRMGLDRVSAFVQALGFFSSGVIGDSAKYPVGHRAQKMEKAGAAGNKAGRRDQPGAIDEVRVYNDEWETELSFALRLARRNPAFVNAQFASLGTIGARHPFGLITDVLLDNPNAYDGKAFFATTHKIGKSATIINDLSATQVPELAIVDKTAPTPEEAAKAVLASMGYALGVTDESGEPANEGCQRWGVMYPALKMGAFDAGLYGNNLSTGTAINALAVKQRQELDDAPPFSILPIPNGRLSNGLVFYIFAIDPGFSTLPFLVQEEEPFRVDVLGDGTEYALREKRVWAGGQWAGGVGPGDFVRAFRCTFSTAT
jgi:hypothetical protein